MQIHNTPNKYGFIAKTLHWVLALLIIGAWSGGIYMTSLPNTNSYRAMIYMMHKSTGMAILMLVVVRLAWRLYDGNPNLNYAPKLIAFAARTVHFFLYVFMLIQPLSGWAMSSAAGYPPTFFGLYTFPALLEKNKELAHTFAEVHEICAWILLGLFILHVSGALVHHFILKDKTLLRMTID